MVAGPLVSPSTRAKLAALIEGDGVTRADPPLLLPAGPYYDLAGEEFARSMLLTTGNDGADYALRPDFTLPITHSYLDGARAGQAAAYGYLGPIFRQGEAGPAEYEQAGIELFAQPDAEAALDRVLGFALGTLALHGVEAPTIRLGGVGLFEALLAQAGLPAVWRPRIRNRFGHDAALGRLLGRLAAPSPNGAPGESREAVLERVTADMLAAGLSLTAGRTPDEIADRYLEQQALDAARVPRAALTLLTDYLAIAGEAGGALHAVEVLADRAGIDLAAPLKALRTHLATLRLLAPRAGIAFTAGFSPRLDYYTGIVFEMRGQGGEVLASGGQYDRLLERLGASSRIAASGCAVWVDRLQREPAS